MPMETSLSMLITSRRLCFPDGSRFGDKSKAPGLVYSIQLRVCHQALTAMRLKPPDGRNLGETRWLRGPKIKGQKPKITTRLSSQRIPVGGTLYTFCLCRRNKSNELQMVARRRGNPRCH